MASGKPERDCGRAPRRRCRPKMPRRPVELRHRDEGDLDRDDEQGDDDHEEPVAGRGKSTHEKAYAGQGIPMATIPSVAGTAMKTVFQKAMHDRRVVEDRAVVVEGELTRVGEGVPPARLRVVGFGRSELNSSPMVGMSQAMAMTSRRRLSGAPRRRAWPDSSGEGLARSPGRWSVPSVSGGVGVCSGAFVAEVIGPLPADVEG